jgi:diacylglycerol kinase
VKYPSTTEKNFRKFLFHGVVIFIVALLLKNQPCPHLIILQQKQKK